MVSSWGISAAKLSSQPCSRGVSVSPSNLGAVARLSSRADLARVPYMAGVLESIELVDGFPALDEAFGSSLDGLYVTGFSATRDFGPFFGFVKGAPAAATLIVRDLLGGADGRQQRLGPPSARRASPAL